MPEDRIVLSALADEAAPHKTAEEQFAALAALGLQYYSLRSIDLGSGVKNAMQLTRKEWSKLRHLQADFGMNVASLASPLGKVKLLDVRDGTDRPFVPFKKYLDKEVARACELAHAVETKLIRGFTFWLPPDALPADHLSQAVDQVGQMVETIHRSDLTLGLEVEAQMTGCTGKFLAEIHRQVNHPALVTVFDGANLVLQGLDAGEVFEEYRALKPSLGWLHIKDCLLPPQGKTKSSAAPQFVPVGLGESGYERILRDLAPALPKMNARWKRRGVPGVVLDLEPHLKTSDHRGGYSGPDGMGVAKRSLLRLLDYVGIRYALRDFEEVQATRFP